MSLLSSISSIWFDWLIIVEIEYTGCRKSSETCRYIFNRLIYQYYTSTKHIIIINVIVFKRDDNFVSPLFERGGGSILILLTPASCDILLEIRTYHQKNSYALEIILRHLWPKRWHVIVGRLPKC